MKATCATLVLLLAGAVLQVSSPSARPASPSFTLAVLPCTDIEATFRKFHPLCEYLGTSAGVGVKLLVPGSLDELQRLLRTGRVDGVLQDPHTWRAVAAHLDASTLLSALTPEGGETQTGVVVVHRDSPVRSLGDLRGRRVMFGTRMSTAKWWAARALFERAGLDVDRDLQATHGGCCQDIAFAVAVRAADAGLVCDHFVTMHPDKQRELGFDMGLVRVLARTAPFPTRVLALRRGVPRAVAERVSSALVGLSLSTPRHSAILTSAEIGAFRPLGNRERVALNQLGGPDGR